MGVIRGVHVRPWRWAGPRGGAEWGFGLVAVPQLEEPVPLPLHHALDDQAALAAGDASQARTSLRSAVASSLPAGAFVGVVVASSSSTRTPW
jgi:hypothetical protein